MDAIENPAFEPWVDGCTAGTPGEPDSTWLPVKFRQSMTCPMCHQPFDVVVTANVKGTAWVDDLSAQVEGNGPACNPYEGMTAAEKDAYIAAQQGEQK